EIAVVRAPAAATSPRAVTAGAASDPATSTVTGSRVVCTVAEIQVAAEQANTARAATRVASTTVDRRVSAARREPRASGTPGSRSRDGHPAEVQGVQALGEQHRP